MSASPRTAAVVAAVVAAVSPAVVHAGDLTAAQVRAVLEASGVASGNVLRTPAGLHALDTFSVRGASRAGRGRWTIELREHEVRQ